MGQETGQPPGNASSNQVNHWKATLLTSPEGRILLLGVVIALGYALWLGVRIILEPRDAQILIGVTATGILFGRAAALAFGYSAGMAHVTVILIAMLIETVFVFIAYPLFVLSWQHLIVVRRLKNTLTQMHEAAEAHRATIQRYGIIGLFVFVWLPFWMTGPVVGCVIGFLLGLRARVNLPVVLAGTYVAILTWALFLRRVHQEVAAYSSYAPMILVIALIIIIVAAHFLQRTLHENKKKGRRRRRSKQRSPKDE